MINFKPTFRMNLEMINWQSEYVKWTLNDNYFAASLICQALTLLPFPFASVIHSLLHHISLNRMNKFLGILFLILVPFTAGIDSGAATPGVGFKTLSRIGRLQIYVRSKKQKESVFDKISEAVDNFDKLKKVER